MAASESQIARSVEPGSMEYGQRQAFESAIGGIAQPQQGAMPGASAAPELGIPSNPLDPLLSGQLDGSSNPLTDGLSVGPGAPPVADIGVPDNSVERLRILATQARSPVLRQLARDALRSTIRERRGQG